jgi:CubicO group peptidase (beta-lactamase class C family)
MKKHSLLAAALSAAVLTGAAAPAAAQPVTYSVDQGADLPPEAKQAAERMMAKGAIGFTVASGQRGAELSRVRVGAISPDAHFLIMSATKWLTAATVLAVVDEGKLSLDKPISTWLPKITGDAGKITLRQLLSQTSGLGGAGSDLAQDHRLTLEQAAEQITAGPLANRSGDVFVYGGPGFQVAGAVVEAVTGKRWAEVFDEKIGRPLGMTSTYWTKVNANFFERPPLAETRNPLLQGGVVTSAQQYMQFLSMLAQGGEYKGRRILARATVDAMLTDQTPKARITPTGANALQDAHYALGNWCETWDAQAKCIRSSSIGFAGTYPWVERGSGRYGIVFIYLPEDAFRMWPEMKAISDALMRTSVTTPAQGK